MCYYHFERNLDLNQKVLPFLSCPCDLTAEYKWDPAAKILLQMPSAETSPWSLPNRPTPINLLAVSASRQEHSCAREA